MTVFFPNHRITIYRNRRKGTADRWGVSATYTAYQADIQPASPTRQDQFNERWGALFSAFVDSSDDIREGDSIQTEDGKRYTVKGVQRWEAAGGFAEVDHLELVMVSKDA